MMNNTGNGIYGLIKELYPICRSITGNGVRQSLQIIKKIIPVTVNEIPSGTRVFDWTVPREWNINDAYIKGPDGKKIIDFRENNLYVLGYSVPVKKKISLQSLKKHLFTIPEHPDWVPYRTTYYKKDWGFCLSQNQMDSMTDGEYEVLIDSSLSNGHMTFGEFLVQGENLEEVLLSTHICHPSMCNDNLSGVAMAAFLARHLQGKKKLRYSYRFLFIPGTIGSITWLAMNEQNTKFIKHGLVIACAGDPGAFTYKKSRMGNAPIDRVVINHMAHSGKAFRIEDFSPYGYDERQLCSPGFNLPVGCFMRSRHGSYPEYHTSADNLEFVKPESLEESFDALVSIMDMLESDNVYINLNPKCEPQLGRRGLYEAIGGSKNGKGKELAMLWVLSMSDGSNSLIDISERSGIEFCLIKEAAVNLLASGLLQNA